MIARVAQFSPKPGNEESVLAALRSHRDFARGAPGCRRAFLATPIHGRNILLYSEWETESDVETFESRLRSDPHASADFSGILGKLSTPMMLGRFEVVE